MHRPAQLTEGAASRMQRPSRFLAEIPPESLGELE